MTDILPSYVQGAWWTPAGDEPATAVVDASTGEPVARVSTAGIDLALAAELYAARISVEFQHVALAGNAESAGEDAHTARSYHTVAPLRQRLVVRALMHQPAVGRAQVLRPLILDMDKRPLPPAEQKMLQPGELEEVLLVVAGHPMRVTCTPCGTAASSTVTS